MVFVGIFQKCCTGWFCTLFADFYAYVGHLCDRSDPFDRQDKSGGLLELAHSPLSVLTRRGAIVPSTSVSDK